MAAWDELWENATVIDTDPNSWLGKVKAAGDDMKARIDDLKTDCEGFQKLATESTLRGAENRKKLEAVKTWINDYPRHEGVASASDYLELLDKWWKKGVVILEVS